MKRQWPQGLWAVTPTGEVLAFHYHQPRPGEPTRESDARWVADTLRFLADAKSKSGDLPPRTQAATDPFPERGTGVTPGGGVVLAVGVTAHKSRRPVDGPVVDRVTLTADEWATLFPLDGETVTVPEPVARKLAPALSPATDKIYTPRPEHVRPATITARRTGDWVHYTVKLDSLHDRDRGNGHPVRAMATGAGLAAIDPATGKPVRLLIVLDGEFRRSPGAAAATSASIEWRAKSPHRAE